MALLQIRPNIGTKRKIENFENNTVEKLDELITFIEKNWLILTKEDKKLIKVKHNVDVRCQRNGSIRVTPVNSDKKQKSISQEELLQNRLDNVNDQDFTVKSRTIKRCMLKLALDYIQYDVSNIDFSSPGMPNNGEIIKITPLSADTVIFVAHADEKEIVNGKFIKTSSNIQLISSFFKAHGFTNVWVKSLGLFMDTDMSYGITSSIPHNRYKISTPDLNLKDLLNLLRDTEAMDILKKNNIKYNCIDIKIDIACTVTSDIRKNIEYILNKEFNKEFHIEKEYSTDLVAVYDTEKTYRAKIYNKFTETILSPGVSNSIGDQTFKWVRPTSDIMEKASMHPDSISKGYSRVEVTWRNLTPPTLSEIEKMMNTFTTCFYKHANFTPLQKQWELLQPDDTVCVYDMFSGNFIFGRFKNSKVRRLNGISGHSKTVLHLIHRLKLCSFHEKNIRLICLDSEVRHNNETIRTPTFKFQNFIKRSKVLSNCIRTKFRIKHLTLHRSGSYNKTHYFSGNNMYSSYITDKILSEIGLGDTKYIKPNIYNNRINSKSSLLDVTLSIPKQNVECNSHTELDVKDGIPDNGEYMFIKMSKENRIFGDSVAIVKCIHMSNGDVYLLNGQWYKWKSLFDLNEAFSFYVVNGVLQLNKSDKKPNLKPSNMMILPDNQSFIIGKSYEYIHYKKKKIVIVLKGYPDVSFFATDQLCKIIKKGYLKFRTIGVGYDSSRHKIKLVEVYCV